jgi:hypothetical protein
MRRTFKVINGDPVFPGFVAFTLPLDGGREILTID